MKWTAMMLPEHLVEIKRWKKEQYYNKKSKKRHHMWEKCHRSNSIP
ncbi:hypothetical protein ACULLL_12705 [Lysinibacillus irui]